MWRQVFFTLVCVKTEHLSCVSYLGTSVCSWGIIPLGIMNPKMEETRSVLTSGFCVVRWGTGRFHIKFTGYPIFYFHHRVHSYSFIPVDIVMPRNPNKRYHIVKKKL